MSCCNKNKCCNAEKFVDPFALSAQLLAQLTELANSGAAALSLVNYLNIKNPAVLRLAIQIAQLAAENTALNKLLNLPPPPATADSAVSFHFGPNNTYCLSVPVLTASDKQAMIRQLSATLSDLQQADKNNENK